jgi:CBS-domain-containing membrane protein
MKKSFLLSLAIVGLFLSSCATTTNPVRDTENEVKVEFNERQLDKYLTQYADQLDLSRRQQRRIAKIEKKYDKQEQKLGTLQIGQKRNLQKEKAEALLNILDDQQIEKLNELAGRKGFFKRI